MHPERASGIRLVYGGCHADARCAMVVLVVAQMCGESVVLVDSPLNV
jgi:hypothetical protein